MFLSGYKSHIISTIVDDYLAECGLLGGYKSHIISTIVDRKDGYQFNLRL